MGKLLKQEEFIERLHDINPKINVLGKYKNTDTPVECECNICKYIWNPKPGNLLHNKSGCPVCAGNKIARGINDLWTTNPELACLLKNKEDGYITSHACNTKKFIFVCPCCGHEMKKRVSEVYYNGLACPKCSDGYSYPEKLMFDILKQLNIEFETQKTFDWIPMRYYDFYIEKYNIIIEVHGLNHYESGFQTIGGKTFEEEIKNDMYKKDMALKNNIIDYIVIDCRYSKLDWCKKSIMESKLTSILGFGESDIDWNAANISAFSSRKIESCNLWNKGKSIIEIAQHFKISTNTVREYLKDCTNVGLCTYNPKQYAGINNECCSKKVICLNTKVVYASLSEVHRQFGLSTSTLAKCCKGKYKYCGKLEDGTKLQWMYYDDYLKSTASSEVSA